MAFATVINCMDGRVQVCVNRDLVERFGAEHIDTITEPGPNAILAEQTDAACVGSILRRVDVSVHEHGSRQVAIVGHEDCAGNPVDRATQARQLVAAVTFLRNTYPQAAVVALWADLAGNVTEVHVP